MVLPCLDRIEWDPHVYYATVSKAMDGISFETYCEQLHPTHNGSLGAGPRRFLARECDDVYEMTGLGSGPQDLGQYVLSNMDAKERRACEEELASTPSNASLFRV